MELGDWSQFGLAGLVIAALFWMQIADKKSHKEERKEWRDAITPRLDRIEKAMDDLLDSQK